MVSEFVPEIKEIKEEDKGKKHFNSRFGSTI